MQQTITITLPGETSLQIEDLKKELRIPESEIITKAIDNFTIDYKQQNVQKIAEMMVEEYETNKDLTDFTSLDSEDFLI